ncbi:unnamed protein product [Blepharisma stoltei]|uniref:t-SNARE coiled-coil homology domain-containing protein n=1 Tax=Blepharisma stoltei TaxID=1481888 RepID=A0AAU9JXB6_9CILI|nr:unnamed protein product [Blepharisma stoltei]
MATYGKLESGLQQQATLVREFQQRLRKLKDITGQIGMSKNRAQLLSQAAKERENMMKLTKEIHASFKKYPPNFNEKIQHDKLTKEFQTLLKQYQDLNQKLLEKEKFAAAEEDKIIEESVETGQRPLNRDDDMFRSVGGLDEAMLRDRQEELNAIEKDMVEVNVMFKDVAKMVVDQGAMLDSAENNVDTAVKETGRAVIELDKAEVYQKKSKGKLYCILAIVCVVVGVLVAIVVSTVVF